METCCGKRKDVVGTFDGNDRENRLESQQEGELRELFKSIGGGKIADSDNEEIGSLLRCPKCGQLWRRTWQAAGHADKPVYYKITLEDAKRDFPDAKLD